MTRRSAYLFVWGITFLAIGMFFYAVEIPVEWVVLFSVAGLLALLGSLTRLKFLDSLAFMALTVTSVLRSFWYLWDYIQTGFGGDIFGLILWLCVGISQVIVAGWPESTIQVNVELDRIERGVE